MCPPVSSTDSLFAAACRRRCGFSSRFWRPENQYQAPPPAISNTPTPPNTQGSTALRIFCPGVTLVTGALGCTGMLEALNSSPDFL
jgi:hypothetical protein